MRAFKENAVTYVDPRPHPICSFVHSLYVIKGANVSTIRHAGNLSWTWYDKGWVPVYKFNIYIISKL